MEKKVKIQKDRLEITKNGKFYMLYNSKLNLFIHADELKFGQNDGNKGWLMFYNANGVYIGSVWIPTVTDMKEVKKFLEETKNG